MKLVLVHARAELTALARAPIYAVSLLASPPLIYLVVGVPFGEGDGAAVMAAFTAYALLGILLFQIGVGVAVERTSPWDAFVRALPVGAGARFAARALAVLPGVALATAAIAGIAVAEADVRLDARGWLQLVLVLGAGAVVFGLLALSLAYLLDPRAAAPVTSFLFLVLALAGGLWTPPESLPGTVDGVSPFVPTRHWRDVLAATVSGAPVRPLHWLVLFLYAAAFAGIAVWAYRRDEGERFS